VAWQAAAEAKPSYRKRFVKTATAVVRQLAYPDIQVLWLPGAHAALWKVLNRTTAPDVIVISGPPFSQFLLAPLARAKGKAIILDYRDEWSLVRSGYEMTGSRIARTVGDPLESALLRCAHRITTATEEFRENLLRRFSFLDPATVIAIPNGYDLDDFPTDLPSPPTDRFTVSHVGTVFRLTSPKGLLGAIRRLHERAPDLARLLDVQFIGRIAELENAAFEGMEAFGVRRLGYRDHDEALRALSASHLNLCILDDVDGSERIYPAKIFELMVIGRPSLTLAPPGALTRLVERHRVGHRIAPRDEEAICAFLAREIRAVKEGTTRPPPTPCAIEQFDRRATARAFADVMRSAVASAKGSHAHR
jgi:glycosyltransferase involved in cell wall biosynthesis